MRAKERRAFHRLEQPSLFSFSFKPKCHYYTRAAYESSNTIEPDNNYLRGSEHDRLLKGYDYFSEGYKGYE